MQERIDKTVTWISKTVADTNKHGIVLGLSGGIDSAVLCGLCAMAIPSDKVFAILMPCYSNEQDKTDALLIADTFKVLTKEICLNNVFDFFEYNAMVLDKNTRLSSGNLKARLRMITQYFIANQLDYLVAGSDDKSESYIGYFTKYGDGASDFAPLANFTKTEVRKIAKLIGVPQSIIDKPSTPGLWEGQIAENELGISYKDIDMYLCGNDINNEILKDIQQRHSNTEHKRCMPLIDKI
jgi:NAD+ synthase